MSGLSGNGAPYQGGPRARRRGRSRATAVVMALCALAGVVAGCAPPAPVVRGPSAGPQPVPATTPDGRGAIRPLPTPVGCTDMITDVNSMLAVTSSAMPGEVICVQGAIPDKRLVLHTSGNPRSPIKILGDGRATVHGISVEGDNVIISGVNSINPEAPGISLHGNNITLENSTSISPRGDDGDALRFWGNDITIRHNTLRDTKNLNHAHADCMQTFATDGDHPASQRVVIDSNRCEDIDNTCLIMEGPHSLAGDGSGVGATSDIRFTNNYCQNTADEALQIDDVQSLTVTGNDIEGHNDHAFALQNRTTGATVSGNQLAEDIAFEVGIDNASKPGYRGPAPGGDP